MSDKFLLTFNAMCQFAKDNGADFELIYSNNTDDWKSRLLDPNDLAWWYADPDPVEAMVVCHRFWQQNRNGLNKFSPLTEENGHE